MNSWKDTYYDESIDNQSGKIFLNYSDPYKTSANFRNTFKYYVGILQSKFGHLYGYEHKWTDRLPSIEMLANPLNIEYLRSKFKLTPEQLCVFALIRKDNEILMGLREYIKNKPVWTYPGGRGKLNETTIDTLKREILEEIGISDVEPIKVIGQKDGVKKDDRVYFIECKISSDPKLMEPEKFKEWKWFPLDQLPDNLIDSNDLVFLKRLK